MKNNSLVAILMFIFLTSCQHATQKQPTSIHGVWESIGSGWMLEIDSTHYNFYDVTSLSCAPNRKGSLEALQNNMHLQNDTLHLLKGVITYQFTKAAKLPQICMEGSKNNDQDVLYNFKVFAETVKSHYAFFELNAIDWGTLYQQQKEKLKKDATDVALYQVIDETLTLLNDNHAFLEATDAVYEALEAHTAPTETNESEELVEYGDFQIAQMVASHYLQEEMTKDSWLIQWGKMTDTIGFIQIKSMWLFADLAIPKQLIQEIGYVDAYVQTFHKMYEGDYIEQEVKGVAKIMDTVMNDLSNMEAIVIDVRFNGGGQDAVSFEILSRFLTQEKLHVATQQLRHNNGFTNAQPLYIHSHQNTYTKPVYVLTSPQTGSAAEAFSIATMSMENVKRIGGNTSGAMSTALEKKLPNGWSFAISNEVYMDTKGKSYENIGIPVHYPLNYAADRQPFFRSIADNLEADKQQILNIIANHHKK